MKKQQIDDYMNKLQRDLDELLNDYIRKDILEYINSDGTDATNTAKKTTLDENVSTSTFTFSIDSKEIIATKISKMRLYHESTINLSLYNYVELEQDTMSILDNFIPDDEDDGLFKDLKFLTEEENKNALSNIFKEILNIKYSKCTNKNLKDRKEDDSIIKLVKYRDFKKIPRNFMEDFVYKKDVTTEDVGWLFNGTKSVESGLIVKAVVENMYLKTKELKLNLTNVFVNYFIDIFKNNIKETLRYFSFDKSYKTDNLQTVIDEIVTYNQSLSEIINGSNVMILLSDIMIYEDIKDKYNVSISKLKEDSGKGDARLFEFSSSNFSEGQIKLKMDLLNKLILFTIKKTYIELLQKNNTVNLLCQLFIQYIFKKITLDTDLKSNNIFKEIKNIVEIKQKKYVTLINTDDILNEGFNISILDIIDKQKISRLKIRQEDDKSFISNITTDETSNIKKLEDLENKLFDEKIIDDTKEEFINNIMFFFKNDSGYTLKQDTSKDNLFKLFKQKLESKIKNYYKN